MTMPYYSLNSFLMRLKIFISVLLVTVITVTVSYIFFRKDIESVLGLKIISPLAEEHQNQQENKPVQFPPSKSAVLKPTLPHAGSLKTVVEKAIGNNDASFGIAIKHMKTGEQYYYNEDQEFDTASLYKLWIMAAVYRQIQDGRLKKEDVLSQEIPVLNEKFRIDPTLAELTEGSISQNVGQALERMITVSDNYSALLLSEKLRLSTVSRYLADAGFSSSRLGEPPISTPSDIASFLEKLYREKLADAANTQEMISLLKKQTLNNKIPSELPEHTVVAHKTGELGEFSHDAGIVYTDKGDYIIVVMTQSASPAATEKTIGKISRAVYEYFVHKNT